MGSRYPGNRRSDEQLDAILFATAPMDHQRSHRSGLGHRAQLAACPGQIGMKKALAALVLATGLFSWSGMAWAYDIVGAGAWSCAAWTDARKGVRSDTTEQWALGFLSGIGFLGQDRGVEPLRGLAPQTVSEWLDWYCRSHPKDTIAHAAEKFSATRQVFSAPSATETVQTPAGSR